MTLPAESVPGGPARLGRWLRGTTLPHFGAHTPLAVLVLGGILAMAMIDAAVVALEIAAGKAEHPYHAFAALALLAIFAAAITAYHRQHDRMARIELDGLRFDEMRRAKEAAETANLAKARYLANVSHEIRSPLNAIYGYAQLVEQEADVRPQDAARIIRRCAEHMTSLVESLLDISRVENGVLRVRSEIVNLADFIDQIVWMMRPAAEAKGLKFIFEASGRLPEFVRTDQSRFRQALINLLSNAIKFTDSGSVTFRVDYHSQTATFSIIDTGPGIPLEDHERVFAPYEQSGQGGESRGVGLGLPITKAIVEILGGKLEFDSEPGKGTSFRIKMMLSEVFSALPAEAASRRIIGHEGRRRSILLVDDDNDQRAFLERFLIGCGFETVAVPNGETAAALCAGRSFDLAVLDINLPGISGWETAIRIRQTLPQDLFIIMASANATEFQRPEHSKPVHDHFFVKPYRLDEMAEVIGALLKLSWKWEAKGSDSAGLASDTLPSAAIPHVERLRELVSIGYVRGIEAEIALLAEAAPGSGALIKTLYAALDEFDLTGMAKLLEGA